MSAGVGVARAGPLPGVVAQSVGPGCLRLHLLHPHNLRDHSGEGVEAP